MKLHALQIGYKLSENNIEKILDEEGFITTYLAIDFNLNKKIAIKEYNPSDFTIRQNNSIVAPKNNGCGEEYKLQLNAFIRAAETFIEFKDTKNVTIHFF